MTDKKKDTPRIEHITKSLLCKLTDDETRQRALRLAKVTQDIRSTEDRHLEVKAQLKAELQALESQQASLANVVARGEEYREVRVLITYDFSELSVSETREDTYEQLSIRAMTDHERQMPLL